MSDRRRRPGNGSRSQHGRKHRPRHAPHANEERIPALAEAVTGTIAGRTASATGNANASGASSPHRSPVVRHLHRHRPEQHSRRRQQGSGSRDEVALPGSPDGYRSHERRGSKDEEQEPPAKRRRGGSRSTNSSVRNSPMTQPRASPSLPVRVAEGRNVSPLPSPRLSAAGPSPAPHHPLHSIPLEAKLHELVKAITPTHEDRQRKFEVLRDVRHALATVGLEVNVYGSLCTGLLIPSSDIDCLLTPLSSDANAETDGSSRGPPPARMPPQLERTLRNLSLTHVMTTKERKMCFSAGVRAVANAMRSSRHFGDVLPIAHAKVPIVKCRHRQENTKVDLSFEKDGLVSSQFLCAEFQKTENMLARPLTVLVKTMIANWGLDDPSVGGLGSFPTAMMVLWFLRGEVVQHYPGELQDSLAVLLVGFLKFYGCDFDFYRQGIDYVKRCTFTKPPTNELFITNPIKPGTSCAKAATLYASRVVPCFAQAAKALSDVLDSHASDAKVEAVLERFFSNAIPGCRDWRAIRRKAMQYRLGAPNQWDPETRIYSGGVI